MLASPNRASALQCNGWKLISPMTYKRRKANREDAMTDDGIFLRNSWYVAAWNHELIDGKKLARTILERPMVLYRGASGKVIALDDRGRTPLEWLGQASKSVDRDAVRAALGRSRAGI